MPQRHDEFFGDSHEYSSRGTDTDALTHNYTISDAHHHTDTIEYIHANDGSL